MSVQLDQPCAYHVLNQDYPKSGEMALGDSAPTTLLQPMPLKSRFFIRCSFVFSSLFAAKRQLYLSFFGTSAIRYIM
jgi:hypothetical protein